MTEEKMVNIILFLFSGLAMCCYLGNENGQEKEIMQCLLNCSIMLSLKVNQSPVAFGKRLLGVESRKW